MRFPTGRLTAFHFSTLIFVLASITAQSAVLNVTNTQDAGADSLRAAVAMAAPGDTIHFNIPTSDTGYNASANIFTITLASGEIVIAKDLTIAGPSAANVAISGNHTSRIFNITAGTVAISNLSLVNGTAKGADGAAPNGSGLPGIGGAVLNQGTLVFTGCTFEGQHRPRRQRCEFHTSWSEVVGTAREALLPIRTHFPWLRARWLPTPL